MISNEYGTRFNTDISHLIELDIYFDLDTSGIWG